MSDIQKCPNLVRGGVNIFQKCLKFKNVPNVGGGGGSTLIGTLSQIFSFFFSDASPKKVFGRYELIESVKQGPIYLCLPACTIPSHARS